jgi:glycosyltransferase involved in cell wall biosynthesis
MGRRLIQLAPGLNPGDAISNEISIIDRLFRDPAFPRLFDSTHIYADHISPDLDFAAAPALDCLPEEGDLLIYHYGIATRISEQIPRWPGVKALIYHNVTPAEYYRPYSLYVAGRLERARRDLRLLRGYFDVSFADSDFNGAELEALGFENVRLLPVLFGPAFPDAGLLPEEGPMGVANESRAVTQVRHAPRAYDAPRLLFVGRVAPNKGHANLIKILYYLRRVWPGARLVIAGGLAAHARLYLEELRALVRYLDLEECVHFTGFLSGAELERHYREANVFVSASEHEGFCVPLLEAMFRNLPVLAYASEHSAAGETMQGAGAVFYRMDHARVAELIVRICRDGDLRERLLRGQRLRVERHDNRRIFAEQLYPAVRDLFPVTGAARAWRSVPPRARTA